MESEVYTVAVDGGVTLRGFSHVMIRMFHSHVIGWYKELNDWKCVVPVVLTTVLNI